ncbi:MAG: cell division topological specificity factor MinE [Lachnospiraceae bacterium]|uniref:cell division topological specificity factor MinE n=1 Tax=Parablautia sp. Marseille-Q6255 TaxID=3039593 RepID=UPI0024BD47E7|nr:cell division topological specificity factor MinE [Parablautia sp. Marseille-Q6255]
MAHRKNCLNTSGKIAKARAKLLVASDRLSCNQDEFCQMKKEVLEILSKYLNLEKDVFEIRMDIVCTARQGVQDVKTIQIK